MADVADRWRRWERTRRMGRRRYVWLVGVCGWGLSVGALWSVAFCYYVDAPLPFWAVLPVALVGFSVGGYVWGAVTWWWSERGFRAAQHAAEAESGAASDHDGTTPPSGS